MPSSGLGPFLGQAGIRKQGSGHYRNTLRRKAKSRRLSRRTTSRTCSVPLWGELGCAIRHARDEAELQRVWPVGLRGTTLQSSLRLSVSCDLRPIDCRFADEDAQCAWSRSDCGREDATADIPCPGWCGDIAVCRPSSACPQN